MRIFRVGGVFVAAAKDDGTAGAEVEAFLAALDEDDDDDLQAIFVGLAADASIDLILASSA